MSAHKKAPRSSSQWGHTTVGLRASSSFIPANGAGNVFKNEECHVRLRPLHAWQVELGGRVEEGQAGGEQPGRTGLQLDALDGVPLVVPMLGEIKVQ